MLHVRLIHAEQFRRWMVFVMGALCLLLSACGGTQSPAQPTTGAIAAAWVGTVEGTDVFVGMASNGKEVMAYVCDGKTISQWFHGQVGVDRLDLVAGTVDLSVNNAKLQSQLTKDTASGNVTLADGKSFKFQAAKASGDSCLYRLEQTINNEKWVAGWVVLNNGQLRGVNVNLNTNAIQPQTTLNNLAKIIGPTIPQY